MFKNRALQVSMVAKDQPAGTPRVDAGITVEQVNRMVLDHTENVAKILGTMYLGKKVIDTASEIILMTGRKYL